MENLLPPVVLVVDYVAGEITHSLLLEEKRLFNTRLMDSIVAALTMGSV